MTTELRETYDYLMQIRKKEYAVKRMQLRREELRSCLLPGAARYDHDRARASPKDKFPDVAAKLDELDRRIEELMHEKALLVIEIGDAIERLPDDREKTVLAGFYIGCIPMAAVAGMINYSPRRAYHFRKQGVLHLGEILEGVTAS